jgi:hypothetical protein
MQAPCVDLKNVRKASQVGTRVALGPPPVGMLNDPFPLPEITYIEPDYSGDATSVSPPTLNSSWRRPMHWFPLLSSAPFSVLLALACSGSATSNGASGGAGNGIGGTTGANGSNAGGGVSPSDGGADAAGGTVGSTNTSSQSGAPTTGGSTTAAPSTSGGVGQAGGSPSTGTCDLASQLITASLTAPEGAKPGVSNWRVWVRGSLNVAPVFTVPLANCGTLVCYTTGTLLGSSGTRTARVAYIDANDKLVTTYNLGAYECRGLAAEPDGHFAALLWVPGTATDCNDYSVNGRIYVKRFDIAGNAGWTTELTNTSTSGLGPNCPTDFTLGESRMDFGAGKYGAYYHVHSQTGHEGDTLKYVDTVGTATTTWSWGCSHSMSNLLRFDPASSKFMPACVTDCYPGTSTASSDFTTISVGGIYINNKNKVMDVDGGCNGSVAGELGSGAAASSGWKIVFNAHQNATTLGQTSYSTSSMNQDVGFASITSGLTSGAVVWLTNTASTNEADASIARYTPACDATEQYVVGWSEPASSASAYKYRLARVNVTGTFIEGPIDVTASAKWGRRDDPFRTHVNGDVVWAWFDAAASTTLRFARVKSGNVAACAAF